jgi:hypothetical protein
MNPAGTLESMLGVVVLVLFEVGLNRGAPKSFISKQLTWQNMIDCDVISRSLLLLGGKTSVIPAMKLAVLTSPARIVHLFGLPVI